MKKLTVLALTAVLTAASFAGCRNRNQPLETTRPSVAPTTQATTAPATEPHRPSTEATHPTETVDHGNGPLESTGNTESTAGENGAVPEGRSVSPVPGR